MRDKIWLYVYEPKFFILASKIDRALIFGQRAETSVKNYTWIWMVVLKLGWPPIKYIGSVFLKDEL